MAVYVDEVQTRVVPVPPGAEESKAGAGTARPGALEEAWASAYQLVRRDGYRTSARDFDD